MKRLAVPTGLSPLEIFERGLAQLGGSINVSKLTVAQASVIFQAEQLQRSVDGKITVVRYGEIRKMLNRFVAAYGARHVSVCERQLIKLYLASLKVGPQTRMNYARNLSFFFGWCLDEGMIFKNPVPNQEGVDAGQLPRNEPAPA